MILPVGHDQIQDGCQIDPHGTLFRHFNIYNSLLDNICLQKKLVSLNIPGGAQEAPYSTRLKLCDKLTCCSKTDIFNKSQPICIKFQQDVAKT